MDDRLQETKRRLAALYLGREGIHGFGLCRSQEAITVYFEPRPGREQEDLLREIALEAAPFRLIPLQEGRANIT